jgi:hypothetical protein
MVKVDIPKTFGNDPQQPWNNWVIYSPGNAVIYTWTTYGDTVPGEWDRVRLLGKIPSGCADTSPVVEFLESDNVQELLVRLSAEYSEEWAGNKYILKPSEKAQVLEDKVKAELDDLLAGLPVYKLAADYYLNHEHPVHKDMTDADIRRLAHAEVGIAKTNGVHLEYQDVYIYLEEYQLTLRVREAINKF